MDPISLLYENSARERFEARRRLVDKYGGPQDPNRMSKEEEDSLSAEEKDWLWKIRENARASNALAVIDYVTERNDDRVDYLWKYWVAGGDEEGYIGAPEWTTCQALVKFLINNGFNVAGQTADNKFPEKHLLDLIMDRFKSY